MRSSRLPYCVIKLSLRLVNNGAAYFDWLLKLCAFDNNSYDDPTILESKIHGSYSLLECRNAFMMRLLSDVERALETRKEDMQASLADVELGLFNALVNVQLAMLSSAFICFKICCDPIPLMSCIRICNNFLPRLLHRKSKDLPLLLMYLHKLLCNTTVLLAAEQQNRGFSSRESRGSPFIFQLLDLVSSLSEKVVKLSRMYFLQFPKNLRGPATLGLYETLFSAYVALFYATTVLGVERSSFLDRGGVTIDELTRLLTSSACFISDYTRQMGCVVIYSQTILALFSFVDLCSSRSSLLESFSALITTRDKCLQLLSSIASRYLLAQLLLDQSAQENSKANEPC